MGWNSFDALITDIRTYRYVYPVFYYKSGLSISADDGGPVSSWACNVGSPGAGAAPTLGLAGAAACDKTTTGALQYQDAPVGRRNWLLSVKGYNEVQSSTNIEYASSGILFDRLAHARLSIQQATGPFSPVISGISRLATGEGGQIMVVVDSSFSNPGASNYVTFNLSYTDQDGNAGTTPNIRFELRVQGDMGHSSYPFIPLASGDSGVRTITDWTLVSGTQTGQVYIVLLRPIAVFSGSTFTVSPDLDFVIQASQINEIRANSCLDFLWLQGKASGSGGGLSEFFAELKIAHG